jgi:RNA polymerase sigma factor (TIGR02999 family)
MTCAVTGRLRLLALATLQDYAAQMTDVTAILRRIEAGDENATSRLLPLVYEELRKLAAVRMAAERPGHTLQPTGLVHEAYVRLVGPSHDAHWDSRGHFFAAAAEAMRRILVDNARSKKSEKRGGGLGRVDLADVDLATESSRADLVDLDEALAKLEDQEPAKAELVKLRYFAGLSIDDAAEVMGISRSTAKRYWNVARAWLLAELHDSGE